MTRQQYNEYNEYLVAARGEFTPTHLAGCPDGEKPKSHAAVGHFLRRVGDSVQDKRCRNDEMAMAARRRRHH